MLLSDEKNNEIVNEVIKSAGKVATLQYSCNQTNLIMVGTNSYQHKKSHLLITWEKSFSEPPVKRGIYISWFLGE